MSLKRSLAGVVKNMWFTDGGGWAVGVGLTGCLRLEAVLTFLVCCLLRVFIMVRFRGDDGESLGFVVEMVIMMNLGWVVVMIKVYGVSLVIRR